LIRLSKSSIGVEEKEAVLAVLEKEFLGMGKEVGDFERNLTEFFNRKASCVSSGTAAVQLALQACNIKENDEVLVQSLTYVATFQAISATGATPIPVDIDPVSTAIDLRDARRKITPKTKAIIPVHYAGAVGDLDSIYEFALEHNLRVIEDAAHAFGTTYKGKLIGSFGDIACFSFDGIKNITSGEGGCVITNDKSIMALVEDSRLLGVHKDSQRRFENARSWDFDVHEQGWRYHMSNIMAAIGIEQLKKFDIFKDSRQNLAIAYVEKLSNNNNIKIFGYDYKTVVPHIFPIIVKDIQKRNELRSFLEANGVQTGIHYHPNHKLSKYSYVVPAETLQKTDDLSKRLITLPLHTDLKKSDINYISHKIDAFFLENN
jgi:dTDP-4-amino-4,6-dideoxygalactose transaminase